MDGVAAAPIVPGVRIRLLRRSDAAGLSEAYVRNRRGIGSAAVRFATDHARTELGLHRIRDRGRIQSASATSPALGWA
ncbi:UNVERIFIED_ORG: hypothetical protein ABIB19_001775 [Arthrobacter sp. UYEF10]